MVRPLRDPWWHVLGLSCGLLFSLLLLLARLYPNVLDRIDIVVGSTLAPFQTLGTVGFFLAITVLGSTLGISLIALAVAYLLRRSYQGILRLFFVLAFAVASMSIAKSFVERSRPDVLAWLDPLTTFSFPSGHATLATALYGFIAVETYRRTQTNTGKYFAVLVPALVILLVASSRVILNVHHFTDVVAGLLLGLFWLSVLYMLPRIRLGV